MPCRSNAHGGERVHCLTVGPDGLIYTGGDDKVGAVQLYPVLLPEGTLDPARMALPCRYDTAACLLSLWRLFLASISDLLRAPCLHSSTCSWSAAGTPPCCCQRRSRCSATITLCGPWPLAPRSSSSLATRGASWPFGRFEQRLTLPMRFHHCTAAGWLHAANLPYTHPFSACQAPAALPPACMVASA